MPSVVFHTHTAMDSEILDLADYSPVGRFLVGTFNTSTTISAAYAAAIVLSSTLAFAALYALLYFGLATQSFSNYNNYNRRSAGGKRFGSKLQTMQYLYSYYSI